MDETSNLSTRQDEAGRDTESRAEILTFGTGVLLFVLGFALALPLATIGWNFFADHVGFVAAVVFSLVFILLLVAGLIVLYRRWIWTQLFRTTEVRLQAFARPLADVARHAASNQVSEAVEAAQTFAQVALARWAWVSTRRWLIASITALIAAMAALAGTALLFRQNELLVEQISRLDRQNALITAQLELADAQRAAGLMAELTAIANGIEAATSAGAPDAPAPAILDAKDLPVTLQARIVAASLAARPYRTLDRTGEPPDREAARRRPDLPQLAAAMAAFPLPPDDARLTERPVSPERGLILLLLYHSAIVKTQALHLKGADFSSAVMTDARLAHADFSSANLVRADFSRTDLDTVNFIDAFLQGAWFRDAVIRNTVFSKLPAATGGQPEGDAEAFHLTNAAGADFSAAFLQRTSCAALQGTLARFDGALLHGVSFAQAALDGATFRNAILLDVDFTAASLKSVDFDGAVVIGEDWLQRVASAAAAGTIKPERFRLVPVGEAEVRAIGIVNGNLGVRVPEDVIAEQPLFRVERVAAFD